MIKLSELYKQLIEGKEVGTLYHFTYFPKFVNIVKDGYVLKATTDRDNYVSLTRNFDLLRDKLYFMTMNVRIVLDGDKLSNRYKIEPYNFFASPTRGARLPGDENGGGESEERIKGNVNIKNCILKVDIKVSDPDIFLKNKKVKRYSTDEQIQTFKKYIEEEGLYDLNFVKDFRHK